jgi:2-haloacid dehalogenase
VCVLDPQPFEYISFDCYGTLIDWEQGILQALSKCFDQFQVHRPADVLQAFARWESKIESGDFLPYRQVLIQVLQSLSNEFSVPCADKEILANSVGQWQPFPDTLQSLERLKRNGYRLAVLSNVDRDMFTQTAEQLGQPFHRVLTSDEIGSYKPDPNNFKTMLNELGCEPDSILHVAQSLYHDHVPARQMGIASVWIDRPSILPGQGATPPADASPDLRLNSLSELADYLVGVDG